MTLRVSRRPMRTAAVAALLAAVAACGSRASADPKNREIPWRYGPTTGGATAEHVQGTGTKGGAPMAKGWQCRLHDGKRLTVQPYQPASAHPLFGKVSLSLSLFDKAEQQIGALRSDPVTAQPATFTFELPEDVAAKLWDLVIWYVAP
jgi:hypothetical protein